MEIDYKGRFIMGMKFAAAVAAITLGLALNAYTNMQQQVSSGQLAKSPRTGHVHWGDGSKDGVPCKIAYRFQPPRRVPITDDQSNAVARAFIDLLESYEASDVAAMKVAMGNLPPVVTNMRQKAFSKLSHPLFTAFNKRFMNQNYRTEFSDVKAFDLYMRTNIELTYFLGGLAIKRADYDTSVAIYEALVLEKLIKYKSMYHQEGNNALEACADKYIADWHRQIESDDSFTRQCMWFQVDLQWAKYKDGSWTLKQLSDWAKRGAAPLTRLGYTPKWLSEFDDLSEAVK